MMFFLSFFAIWWRSLPSTEKQTVTTNTKVDNNGAVIGLVIQLDDSSCAENRKRPKLKNNLSQMLKSST